MERQRDESYQSDGGARNLRRPYTSPELQEWGSIQELTQGGNTSGENDLPKKGGSEPV